MTRDEAIAHVRRLCPPGTLEALGRPSGGFTLPTDPATERLVDAEMRKAIGDVRTPLTRQRVVEQQSTRVDPRAEAEPLDGPPTRRERRISEQVDRVVRRPASGHFQAATRILKEEP